MTNAGKEVPSVFHLGIRRGFRPGNSEEWRPNTEISIGLLRRSMDGDSEALNEIARATGSRVYSRHELDAHTVKPLRPELEDEVITGGSAYQPPTTINPRGGRKSAYAQLAIRVIKIVFFSGGS